MCVSICVCTCTDAYRQLHITQIKIHTYIYIYTYTYIRNKHTHMQVCQQIHKHMLSHASIIHTALRIDRFSAVFCLSLFSWAQNPQVSSVSPLCYPYFVLLVCTCLRNPKQIPFAIPRRGPPIDFRLCRERASLNQTRSQKAILFLGDQHSSLSNTEHIASLSERNPLSPNTEAHLIRTLLHPVSGRQEGSYNLLATDRTSRPSTR